MLTVDARPNDFNDAKARSDLDRTPKKLANLFGTGVGGDIVIVRLMAHDLVAHASPSPQGFKPRFAQAAHHINRKFPLGHKRINPLPENTTLPLSDDMPIVIVGSRSDKIGRCREA